MDIDSGAVNADKRFAPRRTRRLPAVFYIDGLANPVRCVIVDLSSTGARIQVDAGWDASLRHSGNERKRIRLIELKEKVSYDCWVMRQEERELGLRFAAPPVLPALPTPARRGK